MAQGATSAAEALHERPAELLRNLIRFDTSNPPGNERECIAYIDRLLRDAGLETTTRARDAERPSLIARLPGRGEAPPLLLYGHVDVVTTEGQQWRYPPFEARLEDGYVWGRGALDMKSGMAMLISALLRAKAAGLVPGGDVVFCALSDEEGFGDYGAKFLVESHPELFEGIRYAIGEFGGFTLHISGQRFYPIQVSEKQICTLRATVRGQGGHGAMPVRGGAMRALARLLARLDRARLPVHVTPVAREMLHSIAAASPPPARYVFGRLASPPLASAALRVMGERAGRLDPMLRNTVSATVLKASEKVNVIPSEVSVLLDGRLLPGFGPDDLIAEVGRVAGDGVELELVRYDPGPREPDMGLFGMLAAVLRQLDPGSTPVPLLMVGVTDGRFFSRLGIQTYGYLPMSLPPGFDFWQYIHAADERIPAAAVDFGSEAVYRVLERYGSESDA
jgi:acetylornithine deacetylase/succinyl-diaminopimelate desuccinylase-like protein